MAKVNVYFDKSDSDGYPTFEFFVDGKGSFGCAGSIHDFKTFPQKGIITRYKRIEFYDQDVYDGLEVWKNEEMKKLDSQIRQFLKKRIQKTLRKNKLTLDK